MKYDRVSTAFSIANKVVRLITDNASNNISAFGELVIPGFESYFITEDDTEGSDEDDEGQNEFDKCEELLRLPCFIHTLQLAVKDGLNESACIRSAIATVAETAKLSHRNIPVAEKLQEFKLSIPLGVITRWNSQFITVSKIVDIPKATTRTQSEKCVFISLVTPSIVEIYYDLENELKLYKYTSSICNALFKSVKERFGGLLLNLEKPVDDYLKHQ
ncbi:unnamed protein product, partial [Rotaria sp. Silwood2]